MNRQNSSYGITIPYTIILAEDEEDARLMLAQSLSKAGHRVIPCADGKSALDQLQRNEVDLLITDLMMPHMGGIDLLMEAVDYPCIKIVITAFADKQGTIQALNYGADHLIEKPFSAASLLAICDQLLMRRQHSDERELGTLYHRRLQELQLSDSERELATLVIKGAGNRRIASVLGIQEQSVKNRLHDMYRKLGIGSRTELVHLVFPI